MCWHFLFHKQNIYFVYVITNLTYVHVCFECRGAGPGCNTQEIGDKLARLRNEVSALELLESNLDQHKQVRTFGFHIAYCIYFTQKGLK